MADYVRIFSSIIYSTIWQEDYPTRILWITMLSIQDEDGLVEASVHGLANAANITIEECEASLNKLTTPDSYSRDKSRDESKDGSRIKKTKYGWKIINSEYYKLMAMKKNGTLQKKAHVAVQNAIKMNILKRPQFCSRCGSNTTRIEAHHPDYQSPLDVMWLCTKCHRDEHRGVKWGM